MPTVTVRTLATEINVSHDTLIDFLQKKGYNSIKSIMSKIEPDALVAVMKQFGKQREFAQKRQKKVAAFKEKRAKTFEVYIEEHPSKPVSLMIENKEPQPTKKKVGKKNPKLSQQIKHAQKVKRISHQAFANEIAKNVRQFHSIGAAEILNQLSRSLLVRLSKRDVVSILQGVLTYPRIELHQGSLIYISVGESKVSSPKKNMVQNSDDEQSQTKLLTEQMIAISNNWEPTKPSWVDDDPG